MAVSLLSVPFSVTETCRSQVCLRPHHNVQSRQGADTDLVFGHYDRPRTKTCHWGLDPHRSYYTRAQNGPAMDPGEGQMENVHLYNHPIPGLSISEKGG